MTLFCNEFSVIGYLGGDPTFAPATIAPVMISLRLRQQRVRVRVMIGFLVRGRGMIIS